MIIETLADTLISRMPDTKNDLQGWLVLAIVSVFLLLFCYMIIKFTCRNSKDQIMSVTRLLDGYFANFTIILIGLQNGTIKLLEINTAVDIFKAVLKGHCYAKVEMMVRAMSDGQIKDKSIAKNTINQKFKELTQMESNLLNKITYQGGTLGYWLEEFMDKDWDAFMELNYAIVDKYWNSRYMEEMRSEAYNMMWAKVEKLSDKIVEQRSNITRTELKCQI